MNRRICQKRMLLSISVWMAMVGALTVFLMQPPVWGQEPPPYQLPAHQTRALQIVSEKLNLPVTSLWIANDTTRHSVYLNQDVRVVEVRSENRDIQEVVFDTKGKILSSDSGEFYDQDPAIKSLRQALSERLDVPVTALRVLKDTMRHSLYTDRDIRSVEVFDDVHGKFQFLALDREGKIISFDARNEISDQERSAKKARYGKMEPELYDDLQKMGPDDTIKVDIWIKQPADLVMDIPSPTEEEIAAKGRVVIEQERIAYIRESQTRMLVFLEPYRQKIEALRGAKVRYVSSLSPSISAELTREQTEAIDKWDDVREIFKIRMNKPQLDVSGPSVKAPSAWSQGFTGYGTHVGVIEAGGIDLDNPSLSGPNRSNRLSDCNGVDSSTLQGYHATKVAGVIASTHSTYKGMAYDAGLVGATSCTYLDDDVKAAIEWAIANGATALNSSWGINTIGSSTTISKYYDQKVKENRVFIASAAGNCDDNFGLYQCSVISPAIAYNVMAVGGYDDHNTANLDDDTPYRFSSYLDPFTSAAKPEIVAPAVAIKTTDEYNSFEDPLTPGRGATGTSVAAPHVAAAADLMIQRNASLANKPEVIKAILMASALHNIEGDSQFSNRDGAGGLDIEKALSLATNWWGGSWKYDAIYPNSFSGRDIDGGGDEISYEFSATAGQRVRGVISWSVDPNYAHYDEHPGVELSFEVEYLNSYGGQTHICEACGITSGNLSIFEFVAPVTGTYYLSVHKSRFEDASTYLGIAWSTSANSGMGELVDTDGDGMPDNYENAYGLNLNVKDTNTADKDGDGLTNLTEFDLGTPPNQVNSFFTNFPLVPRQSIVKAQDIYELRDGVNAMRASVSLPPISWSNPRLKGRLINAVDIEGLRSGLTPALQARGFQVPTWLGAPLTGVVVKADHLNQVRNAVK